MSDISDDRLRNTRAWAAARVGTLSAAEVIVAACDEALAARSPGEPSAKPDVARALTYLVEARRLIHDNAVFATLDALDEIELSLKTNSPGEPGALQGWQPIETAPTDGRWLACIHKPSRQPFIARFDNLDQMWMDANQACRDPNHWAPLPSYVPTKDGDV